MSSSRTLAFCLLSAGAWSVPAAAQSTGGEFWPELGIYVRQGERIRLDFEASAVSNPNTDSWQGDFTFFVEAALKPVFRRELHDQPDVFRNRYLTFRAGYRYRTSLTPGDAVSENRIILELTPRYHLPWQFVFVDRNRGEFRFVRGQAFSTRYRNRFRLEHDIELGSFGFTPYVYDEIFYDTRYGQWTPNEYAIGSQFPVGPHVVLEPYYLRRNGSHSNPPHINVFGFKLNLYF
jgi:hypothetical protein